MSTVASNASEVEREGRRARKRKLRDRTDVVAVALRNAAKHAENGVPHETIARLFFEATARMPQSQASGSGTRELPVLRRNPLILRFSDGGLYVWIAAAKKDLRKQGREAEGSAGVGFTSEKRLPQPMGSSSVIEA